MKKYVRAMNEFGNTIKSGSYLLDRRGITTEVKLHVPSTTFMERGIYHLCPTDAEYLWRIGRIQEKEALSVAVYCFLEWWRNRDDSIGMLDCMEFCRYAEMQYAPTLRTSFLNFMSGTQLDDLKSFCESQVSFDSVNSTWYDFLRNEYVKIYRIGDIVEFRISSIDGFDWNRVIIDKCILGHPEIQKCKFEIAKQSGSNVKFYFQNATINDILESDKTILSSINFRRIVSSDGEVSYERLSN